MEKVKGIDEYIKNLPPLSQEKISELRLLVQKLFPQAEEAIKYGIPTFVLNKKNLIHFAAYKNHIGFYPGPAVLLMFSDALAAYTTSKGAVQFAIDLPLPKGLIKSILKESGLYIKANTTSSSK